MGEREEERDRQEEWAEVAERVDALVDTGRTRGEEERMAIADQDAGSVDDVPERMRRAHDALLALGRDYSDLLLDGAAEIDRLAAENERLRRVVDVARRWDQFDAEDTELEDAIRDLDGGGEMGEGGE